MRRIVLRLLTCGFTFVFAVRTLAIVPELPEIRALSERLDARYAGAVLERAEPLSFAGLKTVAPGPETLHGPLARVHRLPGEVPGARLPAANGC